LINYICISLNDKTIMAVSETFKIMTFNLSDKIRSYAQMFKLKLTSFVVVSAIMGYFMGEMFSSGSVLFSEIIFLLLGGFLITCTSNALNQVIEKEYDKLMERTKRRPLPMNKLTTKETIWVSSIIGLIGIGMLWMLNPLTGILGALAIFMYVALYTPLKRISTISVFIGAFPGAFPPMLGWVAATGAFGKEAGILFAIQFLWQFPHFWSIAWKLNQQYSKAGFKMLPFGKKDKITAGVIVLSSVTLLLSSFLPEYIDLTTHFTTVALVLLSASMLYPSVKLFQTLDDKYALRTMLMSYLYLIVSLTIILLDIYINK
jgi:protoheme IX farnesyltransferase